MKQSCFIFVFLLHFLLLLMATTAYAQLPPAELQLRTTATGNLLQWKDGGDNGTRTLIRYNIGRATTRGGAYSVIGNSTGLSYNDTTAAAGTTYYYVVRDVHSGGTTGWSEEVIRFYPISGPTAAIQVYKNEKTVWARWPIYENEIVKTFVGLSTVAGEANVVNFVDVGHATEHTFSGVNLQEGQTYHVTVKVQSTSGYLNGYGDSVCSSAGFTFTMERDTADDNSSNYFNNAQARVMTAIGAGSVSIVNFQNNALRRYRMPITLTEPGIESRFNAPVEISLSGNGLPGTLTAAGNQLRVADEWGNEVPVSVSAAGPTTTENYIYDSGTENVAFIIGDSNGTGSQSKLADQLYLRARTTNGAERTYVTNVPVDLTGWDQVGITWSNTGTNNTRNEAYLVISGNQMAGYNTSDERLTITNRFSLRTDWLDVSSINAPKYIRVHSRTRSRDSIVNVFSISLRKAGPSATTMTLIANLPKGKSRNYWVHWGAGNAAYTPSFISNSNDTSQRAWSEFYSRKLLPPGVENFAVSDYDEVNVPSNYDDKSVAVNLPWNFPFFATNRNEFYFGTNSHLTVNGFTTYTNNWNTFIGIGGINHGGMIAPIWCDTMTKRGAPQDSGMYVLRADSGGPGDRMIFYSRNNRYNKLDDIYIHQAVLFRTGDITINYEYLSPGALYGDTVSTDRPVNSDHPTVPSRTVQRTCGISNYDNSNYFWITPLREGIGQTPSSFFQYKNAVNFSAGAEEDAGSGRGFAGHIDSHIFDSRTTTPNWLRMEYLVTANGGRFRFYLRSGSTPEPGAGWTNWDLIVADTNTSGSVIVPTTHNHRFIQYRCVFLKTATGNTPTLDRVIFVGRGIEITKVVANTPIGVSQGQDGIPVKVTVKNFHSANVSLTNLQLNYSLGSYTQTLNNPTLPRTIGPGVETEFTFFVNIDNNSPTGSATINALATGTAGILTFHDDDADIPHTWLVRKKAELSISQIDATPPTVNKGQTVLVRMLIDNPGETPLIFDTATMVFSLGIYNPVSMISPAPGFVLADGASMIATFSVKVDTNSPSGVAILDGTASGRNLLSNKIASCSAALVTDSWIIQNPAKFVVQSVIASDTVYRGQTNIPVFISVSNIGEALGIWETSTLLPFFTLGTYDSEIARTAFPVDIYGGLNAIAEYWLSIAENSATGTTIVDAGVDGIDANTLDLVFANGAIFPSEWTIIGEKVKNYKDPALLFESTSYNRPTVNTVDVFAKASDLAPLKEFTVRWYRPDGTEFKVSSPPLTSDASGTISHQIAIDPSVPYGLWSVKLTNPLNTHTACQNFFEIVSPANIAVQLRLPAKVSIGQTFIASTTVINAGGAVLKSAEPGNITKIGPGNCNQVSGPTPAIQDVAGNASATLNYQFIGVAAGNFSIRSNANGYDGNSDAFLTAATMTSNVCLVQTPPNLAVVSIAETYNSINRNQQNLTVTMTIRNSGQADSIVEAASLTFSLGDHTQSINPPATFPFTLAGGQTTSLIFTVGVTADSPTGAVTVGGSFKAYDVNDPTSVFAITGGSGAWTIAEVVAICSANSSYNPEQYSFNLGQTVFARFTNLPLQTKFRIRFYNQETAGTAVKVSPELNSGAYGVCDDLWTLVPASPIRRWRVIIDSGSSGSVGSIYGIQYFDVQNPGNLQAGLTLSPNTLFVGEAFTATLVATNTINSGSTIAPATAFNLSRTPASTGAATKLSGPSPASATIPAKASGVYSWSYETTADTTLVGSFSLMASLTYSVSGFDTNTGLEVQSNRAVSNSIFIYRRGIDIASDTLDHGVLAPGQAGSQLKFLVINSGNYNLNSIKWATADLRNEFADYVSKAYLEFMPSPLGFIAAGNNTTAQTRLSIPFNQPAGSYIATMSVYEDLNNNDNRDFFEPAKLFSSQVIVPEAKLIVISDPFIDLENWSPGQITNIKKLNYFNGGNLALDRLKIKRFTTSPPAASATFIITSPTNPGLVDIANGGSIDISANIPLAQTSGIYIATYTMYDDDNNNGNIDAGEASATFAVKVGVGNKQFTITPMTVNSGPATPTFTVEGLTFQINNNGSLDLTKLLPMVGTLVSGANSIASENVALFLPAKVPSLQSTAATLNIYIPAGTPIGIYTGTVEVFEDTNGNGVYDPDETKASFTLLADVRIYHAVQIIPSTVDFGDLSAGTGITVSVLCRNIGNVSLDRLLWEKVSLLSGANSIPGNRYSFLPDELPFTVLPGQLFSRNVTINIPAGQPDGSYLGNSSWIFDDKLVNASRQAGEPQDNFLVSCRVGNHFIDIVEAGQTLSCNPFATSTAAIFNIKNNGTLTISKPKAKATILTGPGNNISAGASTFTPAAVGYILQNQTKQINWRVYVPANQAPGIYTGTVTVWNDSNDNNIVDPGEALDTAALSLTVLSKKAIWVNQKPLDMIPQTENSFGTANIEIINVGNIDLSSLKSVTANAVTTGGDLITAASINIIIPNGGALAAGDAAIATVAVTVGAPQSNGLYLATLRIYDDYAPADGNYTVNEESDTFQMRLTIGRKSLTATDLTFAATDPGTTALSDLGTITNTAEIMLTKLRYHVGPLVHQTSPAYTIPAASLTFMPTPLTLSPINSLNSKLFTAQVAIGPNQLHGTYIGTHTVWEDDDGNGLVNFALEATGTFITTLSVNPIAGLVIMTNPVNMGQIQAGTSSIDQKTPVTIKNTGNTILDFTSFSTSPITHISVPESIPNDRLIPESLFLQLLPGGQNDASVYLNTLDASQTIGTYTSVLTLVTTSVSGSINATANLLCEVIAPTSSGPDFVSGTVYQEIATAIFPTHPASPDRFILSAWVAPGEASGTVGFSLVDADGKLIDTVRVDFPSGESSGGTVRLHRVAGGILKHVSTPDTTFDKWYRVYITFEYAHDDSVVSKTYIMLQNLNDDTLERDVLFDGIQLERAIKADQTKPTSYNPGAKIISPSGNYDLKGQKRYFQW